MNFSMLSPKLAYWMLAVLLCQTSSLLPQEVAQEKKFFDVQITKEEIYSYKDLKFSGDYTSFDSPAGHLALGRTEAGVTVLIALGAGNVTFEAPEAAQEKFKAVFGAYPAKAKFKTLYMRLHPKEFDEAFGKPPLTKAPDETVLAKAKEVFDQKFLASYHAGPKAILPPHKTRVMDFETEEFGQVFTEEGYWVALRRYSPYGSVYPPKFVNPKQK